MESKHYIAKDGYTYVRKVDGFRMGDELYLYNFIDGTEDVIENYIEDKKTPEEIELDNKKDIDVEAHNKMIETHKQNMSNKILSLYKQRNIKR